MLETNFNRSERLPTGGEDASGGRGAVRYLLGPDARRQCTDCVRLLAARQVRHAQASQHRVPADGLF